MNKEFSYQARGECLDEFAQDPKTYDVLIIGGGITGAGIALDAISRGLSTLLVDMQDFAAGTSSRSTKLVHGGLRYLKQFEFKMVADVGKERAIVFENGPHVTIPQWMMLPIYKGGTFGTFSTSLGLAFYDFLAGVRKKERRRMMNAEETRKKEPLLKTEGLKGSGYYVEYRTDDARLTIEVLKKAHQLGADILNYTKVEQFIYDQERIIGVHIKDQIKKKDYQVFSKSIINASGPWVDTLREKDKSRSGKTLKLTKGIHLVFDQSKFPLQQSIYFDTPDKRMIFAIPRAGKVYVGTTDTVYEGDIANPTMTSEDRAYLLQSISFMFPKVRVNEQDVESSWAGLRPLIHEEGKEPSEISRKDEIWQSPSGLITIAGGKLTGYRKMAAMVVDLVVECLKRDNSEGEHATIPPCQTKQMTISGGEVGGSSNFSQFIKDSGQLNRQSGLTTEQTEQMTRIYGSNIKQILTLLETHSSDAEHVDLPLPIFATLLYSLKAEMIMKPLDYFVRRTGSLYFDIAFVQTYKYQVIQFMAQTLGWSEAEIKQHEVELEDHLYSATTPHPI